MHMHNNKHEGTYCNVLYYIFMYVHTAVPSAVGKKVKEICRFLCCTFYTMHSATYMTYAYIHV